MLNEVKSRFCSGKKLLFTLLIIHYSLLIANAQIQFQRAIGGTNGEEANSIIQTTDGGYAVAGYTSSFGAGGFDFYIVKLNASSTLQWSKTIGGALNDYAFSITQTTDGGYAVAGWSTTFGGGNADFYIVKLDGSGTYQWSKDIGGAGSDYAASMIQTTDGGYALAGYTNSFGNGFNDFYIVKLNASGTFQWSKTIGGVPNDYANSIIQTTDGGYAVAGYTLSFGVGLEDFYIVKLDASGTLQWSKTIGGTSYDEAYSIIRTTDGGYAVAGWTTSFGAGGDMYIVKLDAGGTLQWSKTVGGTNSDWASSIIQTTDGGYTVGGYTNSFGAGNYDFYIVKLDGSGTLQWSRTIGGTGDDRAHSIIQTTDGGYAVAGASTFGGNGDFYVAKLDASGNTCGNSTSPTSTVTSPTSTLTTPTPTVTTPTNAGYTPAPTTSTGGTITNICTFPPPAAPVLYSPPNNSAGQPLSLNLIWYTVPTAFTYRVQLATDSLFNNLIVNDSTVTDSLKAVSGLVNNTLYFWRVNAKNVNGGIGSWSAVWRFRTIPLPPAAPVLFSPPNNSTGQPLSLNLVWYRVPTAVTYRVQLSTDSLLNTLIINDSTVTDSLKAVSGLTNNTLYFWRVNAKNAGGIGPWSFVWRFRTLVTGIQPISSDIPKEFKLYANYPNPFNPATKIKFDIPSNVRGQTSDVKIIVYDILGREVLILVDEQLKPGAYEVEWNATNYSSGVYFYKLSSSEFTKMKRMVLIK